MDKQKLIKTAIAIATIVVPFGLTAVGGYYAFKYYKKKKSEKDSVKTDSQESKPKENE